MNKEGESCLIFASMRGNLEMVQLLIENGYPINEKNKNGESCLMIAAKKGHLEIVKWLFEKGCAINEKGFINYQIVQPTKNIS